MFKILISKLQQNKKPSIFGFRTNYFSCVLIKVCVCVATCVCTHYSLHLSYYYRQLRVNLNAARQAGETIHYLHNQALLLSLTQKE